MNVINCNNLYTYIKKCYRASEDKYNFHLEETVSELKLSLDSLNEKYSTEIKEDVRKEYEHELEHVCDEILTYALKIKDNEINTIKNQLNEAHKIQLEKLRARFQELASKEAEKSLSSVKNEVMFAQEIKEKIKIIENFKIENKNFECKIKCVAEQKEKEMKELKAKLIQVHKKEVEHLKQAFEIELSTRVETVLEEKVNTEGKLKKQLEAIEEELKRVKCERIEFQVRLLCIIYYLALF